MDRAERLQRVSFSFFSVGTSGPIRQIDPEIRRFKAIRDEINEPEA